MGFCLFVFEDSGEMMHRFEERRLRVEVFKVFKAM